MSNLNKNKVHKLVLSLLKLNGYRLSNNEFELQLYSHPEFPSLKAVTDTLDFFKIDNIALKVNFEALSKLPNAFLAVLNNGNLNLVSKKSNKFKLTRNDSSTKKIDKKELESIWSGFVIAVEANKKKDIRKTEFNFLWLFIATLLVTIIIINVVSSSVITWSILSLSFVGLFVSYIASNNELNIEDIFQSKFCYSDEKENNCSKVINSKGSKVFGSLSLADLSLTYFLSSIFQLTFLGFDHSFFLVLSILGIPIVLYSIYYQKFVSEVWCGICLFTVGTFLTSSIILIASFTKFNINHIYWLKAFSIGLSVLISWMILKKNINLYLSLKIANQKLLKFKRDYQLFKVSLANSTKINTEFEGKLKFGSSDAKIKIDLVLSPYCKFCKTAFSKLVKVLDNHKDKKISLDIIFNVNQSKNKVLEEDILNYFINIYHQKGPNDCLLAIKDWYDNPNAEKWLTRKNVFSPYTNLKRHIEWCMNRGINYSPLTLINGSVYPIQYNIEDIFYFIDELTYSSF